MKNMELLSKPIDSLNMESFTSYLNRKEGKFSLNGEWKFIYLDVMDDKYLDEIFDISKLNNINVPSHIELNGYSEPQYVNMIYPWEGKEDLKIGELPKNNPIGIYFKDYEIKDLNKDYYLEFEGFEAALYLYVNGKFVGYSTHNFVTSTFKINEYIKEGNNRITVVIFKYSFASWYTDQDMFRLSGINRPINLLCLDKIHFKDIHNKSILKDDYLTGLFDINFKVSNYSENTCILLELSFNNEVILNKEIKVNNSEVNYQEEILNVLKWSDEEPNLYSLRVLLKDNDNIKDEVNMNIGFRRIEIKSGVIYLNNKRLVLRGVNRHEFNHELGRVMTKELIEKDLKIMKRMNINAIRTSHYPNVVEFYEMCDKYGFIVMDEVAIETHGTWQKKYLPKDVDIEYATLPGSNPIYREFTLKRGEGMFERDKNFPCILFLSLGNESHAGKNLEELSSYFKKVGSNRIVHYEGCFHNPKYAHISDVTSRMYFKPKAVRKYLKKDKVKPFIECEFSHAMGNSNGNFDEYMELLDEFKNYQGGFIWDFVDQGILKDGRIYYGGDFKDYPNDNNFCANGLILADRTLTPKVDTVKYYYSNIQFDISKDKVEVINKNSFIDTSNLEFKYYLIENGVSIYEESFELNVEPLSKKKYKFNKFSLSDDKEYVIRVGAYLKEDTWYATKGFEINFDDKFIKGSLEKNKYFIDVNKKSNFKVYKSVNHLTVENGDLKVIFRGIAINNGGLEAIIYQDKIYLDKVVFPTLYRANTDNDAMIEKYLNSFYLQSSFAPFYNPLFNEVKVKEQTENKVVVEVTYQMLVGLFISNFRIKYTIYASNEIKVDFVYKKPVFVPKPPVIGMRYKFHKEYDDFSYLGLGKVDTYRDRYKGVKYGVYESKASEEFVDYSIPQECGNHEFTKEVCIPMFDKKLKFIALDDSFGFKYQNYNEFEIELAERRHNLPISDYNYLTIYAINKGVGGDDSWGARVHKKYRVNKKKYKMSYIIKIEE